MRNTYEVLYQKYVFDNEQGKQVLAIIGRAIVNDDNVNHELSLECKAFKHAPYDCRMADKISFYRIHL